MKWENVRSGYTDRVAQLARLSPEEILGVEPGCSEEALKQAYHRLIKTYHPDRSAPFMKSTNGEILKLINSAYETLKGGK